MRNDESYQLLKAKAPNGKYVVSMYYDIKEEKPVGASDKVKSDNKIYAKLKNIEKIGTYEEFSEANRLIAQIKRSVAFGATYHPFAQNKNNGVTSEIDIAVMEDMPAFVQTPNGVENEVDSMDGSGISDALEARFELARG